MVKNEISIKASETRRVASNMQDVEYKKVTRKISKELATLHTNIQFNTKDNANAIYELQVNSLKEEVSKLYDINPYEAIETLHNNQRKENLLAYSFVKIDRVNLENEKVKAIIANHRHSIVKIDNNILKAKLNKEEYANNYNRDVKFNEEYHKLIEAYYKETDPRLEEIPYSEFIKNTKREYDNQKQAFDEEFSKFFKEILAVISDLYLKTSSFDEKEETLSIVSSIEANLKQIKKLAKENKEANIDLATLNEQEKEKLDVKEEKETLTARISEIKEDIAYLEKANKELKEKIKVLEKTINATKTYDLIPTYQGEEKVLLEKIVALYINKNKELSKNIFLAIREYAYSKLECYSTYYYEAYKSYLKDNEAYQKMILPTLDENTKKVYAKKETYLAYLQGKSQSDIDQRVDRLKETTKQDKANLFEEFKNKLKAIKEAKKARIAEYKKQKANAKVALKVADAAKASELKEIVKLYKKEINTGEYNRYVEAHKQYFKDLFKINANYNLELTKITKPEATYTYYKYDVACKKDKKKYSYKHSTQNRELRKEASISKYRKNMTVSSRENILGYLFLAIWAVGFIALTLVPIIYTFLLVGSDITYTNQGYSKIIDVSDWLNGGKLFPNWVGTANFETLFLTDINFLYTYIPRFFRNLLLFVPIVVFISFVLALLLNTKIKGRTLFRIIYFLPVVIVSGPILTLLNDTDNNKTSSITLSLDGSAVATILQTISPKVLQYANEVFQNFIIILWMTGVPIVLFISALQKINRQLYEAADIDGANGWQKLWTITFPLIKSVMLIVCLFTIMQVTTINYSGVNPINGWISNNLSQYNYSIVALGAWVQTIIVLLFVLIAFLLFREKEFVSKQKSFEEMEAFKKKKQARQQKLYEFFHIGDIKNFFTKVFGPVIKAINVSKEKRRIKKEQGGK